MYIEIIFHLLFFFKLQLITSFMLVSCWCFYIKFLHNVGRCFCSEKAQSKTKQKPEAKIYNLNTYFSWLSTRDIMTDGWMSTLSSVLNIVQTFLIMTIYICLRVIINEIYVTTCNWQKYVTDYATGTYIAQHNRKFSNDMDNCNDSDPIHQFIYNVN